MSSMATRELELSQIQSILQDLFLAMKNTGVESAPLSPYIGRDQSHKR